MEPSKAPGPSGRRYDGGNPASLRESPRLRSSAASRTDATVTGPSLCMPIRRDSTGGISTDMSRRKREPTALGCVQNDAWGERYCRSRESARRDGNARQRTPTQHNDGSRNDGVGRRSASRGNEDIREDSDERERRRQEDTGQATDRALVAPAAGGDRRDGGPQAGCARQPTGAPRVRRRQDRIRRRARAEAVAEADATATDRVRVSEREAAAPGPAGVARQIRQAPRHGVRAG